MADVKRWMLWEDDFRCLMACGRDDDEDHVAATVSEWWISEADHAREVERLMRLLDKESGEHDDERAAWKDDEDAYRETIRKLEARLRELEADKA